MKAAVNAIVFIILFTSFLFFFLISSQNEIRPSYGES